jgi:hypothetical protein
MNGRSLAAATVAWLLLAGTLHPQGAGVTFDNQVSTWLGMNFPDETKWQSASGISRLSARGHWQAETAS